MQPDWNDTQDAESPGAEQISTEGAGTVTDEAFIRALAARHGGERSRRQLPGEKRSPLQQYLLGPADPVHRITFGDDKWIEVTVNRGESGAPTGTYTYVKGTAQAPGRRPPAAAPYGERYVVQADGSQILMHHDPKTGELVPTMHAGELVIKPAPRGPRGATQTPEQARARTAQAALAEGRLARLGQPTPLAPETAEWRQAQASHAQAQAAQLQRKMVPEALQALRDLGTTVAEALAQYRAGTIDEQEMLQYWDLAQEAAVHTLKGTTAAKQEAERQKQITERAKVGRDLLNQRVQSGTNLAQSMYTDYRKLLAEPTTKGFDYEGTMRTSPLETALLLTRYLGGGDQVSDVAKALLGQAAPGGAPPAATMPRMRGLPTPPGETATMDYRDLPQIAAVLDEEPIDEEPEEED